MLHGELVDLRARLESDVAILHAEIFDDVVTRSAADSRPWRPTPVTSGASPYSVAPPTADAAIFSVVNRSDRELAGEALLWHIDTHNRTAHLGISLRPSFRGRGLGSDVVHVLCDYGFNILGLHRLQLETLARNAAMIAAATKNGFKLEGTLRQSAWVDGDFVDEVIMGLLVSAATSSPSGAPRT